ncbi:GNAT family N-acetyltransferase [Kitasatospora sp. NPDC054939]
MNTPAVKLSRWTAADLPLLHRLNSPEMRRHTGEQESAARVLQRHRAYLAMAATGSMGVFRISVLPGSAPTGTVGLAEQPWEGEQVLAVGCNVLPKFQRRGVAAGAMRTALGNVRAEGVHRTVVAFSALANPASTRSAGAWVSRPPASATIRWRAEASDAGSGAWSCADRRHQHPTAVAPVPGGR